MPAPMPGGSGTGSTSILGGGKGSLRGVLPNIYSSMYGGLGGFLGGGYETQDPTNRKRRMLFTRRWDQNEGTPGGGSTGGGGGGGSNQGQPDLLLPPQGSVGQESPVVQPLRQFGGDLLGDPYTRVEPGTYDNDELWRMYRSQKSFGGLRSRPRSFGGMGAGMDGIADDPIKKLIRARFGGGF